MCEDFGRFERFERSSVGGDLLEMELLPFYLASFFFKSLRNHTSHQVGGLFGGTLIISLITEPLGFVQDA